MLARERILIHLLVRETKVVVHGSAVRPAVLLIETQRLQKLINC